MAQAGCLRRLLLRRHQQLAVASSYGVGLRRRLAATACGRGWRRLVAVAVDGGFRRGRGKRRQVLLEGLQLETGGHENQEAQSMCGGDVPQAPRRASDVPTAPR